MLNVLLAFDENQSYPLESISPIEEGAATSSAAGLIGTIIIFLIILFGCLWIIKKLNRATMRGMSTSWARVLDRQMLSHQHSLYLVEIAGKLQVLGGTDHNLVKIAEINDVELAAEILEEIANRPIDKTEGFLSNIFDKVFLGRKKKDDDPFAEELERLLKEVEK